MIVKYKGQNIQLNNVHGSALTTYHNMKTSNHVLTILQEENRHRLLGTRGVARNMLLIWGAYFMQEWNPIFPESFWTFVYWSIAAYTFFCIASSFSWSLKVRNGETEPKVSHNKLHRLDLVDFRNDGISPEEAEKFSEEYYDFNFTSVTKFINEPLKTPILFQGEKVIGAFAEVNANYDTEKDEDYVMTNIQYYAVLEDARNARISGEVFRSLVLNIQKTEDGQEYWVPVLTGLKQTVIQGAIVEMFDTIGIDRDFQNVDTRASIQHNLKEVKAIELVMDLLKKDHPIHQHVG